MSVNTLVYKISLQNQKELETDIKQAGDEICHLVSIGVIQSAQEADTMVDRLSKYISSKIKVRIRA